MGPLILGCFSNTAGPPHPWVLWSQIQPAEDGKQYIPSVVENLP